MSTLPATPPPRNDETEPFWAAVAEGRLAVPVCDACGHHIWYPRAWCPVCGGTVVTWTQLSGQGRVYALTVVRKSRGPWADAAPYVVAYVELAEGPRVLTNIVTSDPDSVVVGMPVHAVFDNELLRFAPD